jgi:hypothetical protein
MLPGFTSRLFGGKQFLLPSQALGNDSYTVSLLHFDAPDGLNNVFDPTLAAFKDYAYGAPPSRRNAWTIAAGQPYTAISWPFNQVGVFTSGGAAIQCPDAPDLNPSPGVDFTIDFWFAYTSTAVSGAMICGKWPTSATPGGWMLYQTATQINFYASSNGSTWDVVNGAVAAGPGIAASTWYHFALVRTGNTYKFYVNGGLQAAQPTSALAIQKTTVPFAIGGIPGAYGQFYMDEFRFSNGIARWTAAFTPPNQPYYENLNGGNDSATKLLLHFDNNAFTLDSAVGELNLKTVTSNGATQLGSPQNVARTLNVAQVQPSGAQRITVANSAELNFMKGNFTFDLMYYRSAAASGVIFTKRDSSGQYGPIIMFDGGNGTIALYMSTDGSTWALSNVTIATGIALSTWYHLALVRNGPLLTFYVNGAQTFQQNIALTPFMSSSQGLQIGSDADTTATNALFEEFRYSDVARWTAPFTAPVAGGNPYVPDPPVPSTLVLDVAGRGRWKVPADWNNICTIECIGGGGGGAVASGGNYSGSGGGGGGYSKITNLVLTPGSIIQYNIGAGGGFNVTGGDTWFNSTASVLAKGGVGGSGGTPGAGGAAASGVGTTKFSGGAGGAWSGGAGTGTGGGAGGRYGNGGAGAAGNGAGGGGGGGGTPPPSYIGGNGANASGVVAGTGGQSGGAAGSSINGSSGGGGAGGLAAGTAGGAGGNGTEFDATHGSGGGGGSGAANASLIPPSGNGGLYGGGGGGGTQFNAPTNNPGVGGRGVIFITYSGGTMPAATHFSVTAPASASVGASFNVTVQALDASNQPTNNYAGTVHLTSTDPLAVLGANAALANGVGTFTVQPGTVGNFTVTATDTITSSINGTSAAFTVSSGPATPQTIFVTAGSTWTVPSDWLSTKNTIEVIGGGGGGSGGGSSSVGGGGGGGGYSKFSNFAATPGQVINLAVGGGGGGGTHTVSAGAGGDTWFNSTATVLAKGGGGGVDATTTAGGAAASGIGATKTNGGAGSGGRVATNGGGGGGAGGPNGDGGAANVSGAGGAGDAGAGGAGAANGGNGGAGAEWTASAGGTAGSGGGGGGDSNADGHPGGNYGGGGGGGLKLNNGGAGIQGLIVIKYG